jgi:serine/threonine-protein kinase
MDMISEPASVTQAMPELFKHYRLDRRLGQGGYGEVFEAWDTVLRRRVAIKRLSGIAGLERPGSLIHEARLGASLQHPAFVKIYSIESAGAGHAIVMELVSGITLREFIARGGASLETIRGLVGQAAAAMQAAHACGLVHGDLKPSNLMLGDDGRLRILDLGLAFHDDAQATTSVMQLDQQGTIAYMAPERLLGTAPNRQSDVYALGVVLYELIAGTRPFAALSGLALAAAQMQSSSALWEFPASTPRPLVDLVHAMTARPDLRLASMQMVSDRLTACADGPAGPAPRRPAWRGAGWRKVMARLRRPLPLAVALAAVLVFGAWRAAPYLAGAATPFSRSATIGQALLALESFDQPERLDAAAASLAALLERDPRHAAAVAATSLVASFRYAGDTQDETWLRRAAAAAQQALRLEPALALSHVAQAWVLANQGQRDAALAEAETALGLDPDNYFAAVGKVTFLTQLQRYDEARAWAQAMLVRHPRQRVFADALGTVYYAQGNYAAAEQAFRLSIKMQPDAGTAYANLNAALLRLGRNDEALQAVQQGLLVSPSAGLYTNLGNALFLRGDYVGAAAAFERAVAPPAGNPNSYLGWANLGDTLLWIPGRAQQAQEAYRSARDLLSRQLARAPGDSTLLSRMGLYAARSADAAGAMAFTGKALAAAQDSPDVHFRAALAYELLHQRERALAEIAQAKRLGYPASAIDAEPEFVALRRDARYQPH